MDPEAIVIFGFLLLAALTFHEWAHAAAATACGDDLPREQGRLTLNPLSHIDLFGTILLPIILLTMTGFVFGYAKPVPVNFSNLRNPKKHMVWVALAGPASNFIQAIGWAVLLVALVGAGVDERFFIEMARAGVLVNLVMWAFNLFPLPPLDGGRILVGLLPYRQAVAVSRIEPWGFFIVMALVVAGVVSTYWLQPLMAVGSTIVTKFEMRPTGPVLLREPKIDFVDDGPGKPVGINRHIGRRPILAFGNSDGDLQMLQWTAAGGGARFMGIVHHTDATREWAYDRTSHIGKLDKALDEATAKGWTLVDMKADWRRVFPFEK